MKIIDVIGLKHLIYVVESINLLKRKTLYIKQFKLNIIQNLI